MTRHGTDVLGLGSGSAGLVAALTAAAQGLARDGARVDRAGGRHHRHVGGRHLDPRQPPRRRGRHRGQRGRGGCLWQAFVAAAPEMLRFVEDATPLRFALTSAPDPPRGLPGHTARGRMLRPRPLSRWRAGRFALRIRKSTIPELFTCHEAVETDLYHHPWRSAASLRPRLLWRVLTNMRGKGTPLVTGLLRGCLDRGVRVLLEARAVARVQDDDADGAGRPGALRGGGGRERQGEGRRSARGGGDGGASRSFARRVEGAACPAPGLWKSLALRSRGGCALMNETGTHFRL